MAANTYPRPFRIMHWLTALVVLMMLVFGQRFETEMPEADRLFSLTGHSSLGAIVVLLVVFRLVCRFTRRAGPPDHGLPRLQQNVARTVQWALYALLVFVPITGILTARAHELPVRPFNAFDLSTGTTAGFDTLRQFHEWGTWALMALLVLHIGAALMHAAKRDGVLGAMNPLKRPGQG